MLLEAMIESLPLDRRWVVLLRHAEREAILTVEDTIQALLNEAGKAAARQLGARMACIGTLQLFHSPVPRCRQTAEALSEGARAGGAEAKLRGPVHELGGPYVKNWKAAMEHVFTVGMDGFVQEWFDGCLPADLVVDPHTAARQQLRILAEQLQDPAWTGCSLNVTHDWNLLLVRNFAFGNETLRAIWPDYLEGVAAFEQDGDLHLRFGQTHAKIRKDDLPSIPA